MLGLIVSMSLLFSWYWVGLTSILLLSTNVEGNQPKHENKLPLLTDFKTNEDIIVAGDDSVGMYDKSVKLTDLNFRLPLKLLLKQIESSDNECMAAKVFHRFNENEYGSNADGYDTLTMEHALSVASRAKMDKLLITIGHVDIKTPTQAHEQFWAAQHFDGFVDMDAALQLTFLQHWPTSMEEQLSMLKSLCKALVKLHSFGVVHGDVDLECVMIDAGGRVEAKPLGEWEYLLQNLSAAEPIGESKPVLNYVEFLVGQNVAIDFTEKLDLYLLAMTHALWTDYGSPLRHWMEIIDQCLDGHKYEEMIRLAVLGPLDLGHGTATNNNMKVKPNLEEPGSRIRIFSALSLVPDETYRVEMVRAQSYLTVSDQSKIQGQLKEDVYNNLLGYCSVLVRDAEEEGMSWLKTKFLGTMEFLHGICQWNDDIKDQNDSVYQSRKVHLCKTVDVLCEHTEGHNMKLKMSESVKKIYETIENGNLEKTLKNALSVLLTFDLIYDDFIPYLTAGFFLVEKSVKANFDELVKDGIFGDKADYYTANITCVL
eukprot:GHVS01051535.1.p1 GENE.GHVS01051535.1~~GHVS01051535.1.p1  ORF type:complete len:540 (+),score=49.41 GHVS01051535.1:140-1759(+)